jgi:hypothetical protein
LYALAAADKSGARDFKGRHIRADNQQRTVAAKSVKNFRHGLGTRGGGENDARTAKFFQLLCRAAGRTVDIVVRAQFFRERGIFRAASDSSYTIPKFIRELNAEVA